jgi:mannose-6-phosphate isomerase
MIFTPIFFEKNRVERVYVGGKLFSGFFGDDSEDSYEPEEWIASGVKALNKIPKSDKDGVSKVLEKDLYFDELIEKYPKELLGSKMKLRVLVKILDSAIRLPAQAHPDKEFSRKYFNSEYGKTECWIVLDTRPDAKIYFGFKDGVTREDFELAIDESEHDKDAMERLMSRIDPQKNGVYLVPAKTVHAIGAGCLILEIQEPTDFTIQPERFCGEYKLSDKEMYLGLTREQAIKRFDFGSAPNAKVEPVVLESTDTVTSESLISKKDTDCFVINRISLCGGERVLSLEDTYGIYVVTRGEGRIFGEGYTKALKKGDYFFMPASLMGKYAVSGNMEIVECY